MSKDQSYEQRMNALRQQYRESMPERASKLRSLWQNLLSQDWDAETASEIGARAHRLAGTGKTFGLSELSETALHVDQACARLLEASQKPSTDELLSLERAVGKLLAAMDEAHIAPNPAAAELPTASGPVNTQSRIAVIDDDPDFREHLNLLLSAQGYQVKLISSPNAAVELLGDEPPSLVILDLFFPGHQQPALDTIGDIRTIIGSRVPVIAVSALTDFTTRVSVARAGANLFLGKPVSESDLISGVNRLSQRIDEKPLRCLVVEDDDTLLQMVQYWLERAGMGVRGAATSRQAWVEVEAFEPDVVLADIRLPDCSGIELASIIRQTPGFERLPVIFMTADESPVLRHEAFLAGGDEYLTKPLDEDDVTDAVTKRGRLGRQHRDQLEYLVQRKSDGTGLSRHFFYTELDQVLADAKPGSMQPVLLICALDNAALQSLEEEDIDRAELSWQFAKRIEGTGATRWSMLGDFLAAILIDAASGEQQRAFARQTAETISDHALTVGNTTINASVHTTLLYLGNDAAISSRVAMAQAQELLSVAGGDHEFAEGRLSAVNETPLPSTDELYERLRLFYQPVITIDGAGVNVRSVFVRMRDQNGAMIPIAQFIDDVRQQGALPGMDLWVVRSAHGALCGSDPDESALLLVQVSDESLKSAEFMNEVSSLLEESPMPSERHRLVFSVSERGAITSRQAVQKLNEAALASGCALMFNDYGSTSESTSLMQRFTPLFARLSSNVRKRLSGATELSPSDQDLVKRAQQANSALIASDVEDAPALSALWSKGVRRFQGYFLQEPSESWQDT